MNSIDDKKVAAAFIKKNFIPSEKLCRYSAYNLKHILQHSTNIYFTEREFVNLLEGLGYKRSPRGKWMLSFSTEVKNYLKGGGFIC